MCIRIARRHSENLVQNCLRFIQLAEEHVTVGLIDQKHHVLWLFINRLRDPLRCLLLVTQQTVNRANEIQDNRIAVVVLDCYFQGQVSPGRLPGNHVQPCQVRPGRTVIFLQFRDRTECTDRSPVLLELQGNQADQEMRLHEVGFGAQESLATCRRFVAFARSEKAEALSERVLHPRCGPDIRVFTYLPH